MKPRQIARPVLSTALIVTLLGGACLIGPTGAGAKPKWTQNCTQLNKRFPHGLGRATARDKTSSKPVTNFKRSNRLFAIAMSHNKGLDRDKDKIACEKA